MLKKISKKELIYQQEFNEKEKCILNDQYRVLFNYLKINKKVRWVKIVWNARQLVYFYFIFFEKSPNKLNNSNF